MVVKKSLLVFSLALCLLLLVLLVRTLSFCEGQDPVQPLAAVSLDSEAAARRLAGAIRFETISHQDSARFDPEPFDGFHAYLAKTYPEVHAVVRKEAIDGYSLLFKWEGRNPNLLPILLSAHQDVVPVAEETLSDWTHPPFAGRIADGYVWGRGSLDMKSGLIGVMEAVTLLLREGFQPERDVYLAFGHDEEVGGSGGAARIAEALKQRGVRLAYVLDEGGMIVEGVIPGVSAPVALVGFAEKGYATIELTVRGIGGHASMPPPQTTVGVLSKAITRLEENPFATTFTYTRPLFSRVGPRLPFMNRVIFANLWLFDPLARRALEQSKLMNAMLRTTTAATVFHAGAKENVLPISSRGMVNFRILPGDAVQALAERVRVIIDDPRVQIRVKANAQDPSPVSDLSSDSFRLLARTIRGVSPDSHLIVAPYVTVAATDSRHYAAITDNIYRFLYNTGDASDVKRIHGTDERISVRSYVQAIAFYYHLIRGSMLLPEQ